MDIQDKEKMRFFFPSPSSPWISGSRKRKAVVSVMSLSAAFLRPAETLGGWTQPWAVPELGGTPGGVVKRSRAAPAPYLQGHGQPSCLLSFLHLPPKSCPQLASLMSHLYHQSSALVSPTQELALYPSLDPPSLLKTTQ